MNYLISLASSILLVFLIIQCVRIVREDERLIILEMGKMTGYKEPGIQFLLPGSRTYVSVVQGDPGELLGMNIAHINGYHLPVRIEGGKTSPNLPSLVQVCGFHEDHILVECIPENSQ